MLRLRKNKILPQQVSDLGAFIFVVTMIPITYIWEVSEKLDSFIMNAQLCSYSSRWLSLAGPYFHKMALHGTSTWLSGW